MTIFCLLLTLQFLSLVFVYMAQALCTQVPSFCLACFGTDNRFTTDNVLKRWKYIYKECQKRGITVVSFGADGDARELCGMKVSSGLFSLPHPNIASSLVYLSSKFLDHGGRGLLCVGQLLFHLYRMLCILLLN